MPSRRGLKNIGAAEQVSDGLTQLQAILNEEVRSPRFSLHACKLPALVHRSLHAHCAPQCTALSVVVCALL